ncbi:MAG: enoyl-CoA hydratase/isomerase family protein [Gordonia polyisoprenivorans]|nr:enoyl-CoA hydratase/isomerase family protein [Gordonia polyisoprenivorans]
MAHSGIGTRVDGPVGIITINRPEKHNTLTLAMIERLREVAAELDSDPNIRAIVVTGAGDKAFSAGGDLRSLLPAALEARSDVLNPDPTARFFSDVFTPVLAAIEGICVGGGFEIMLGTDIRVAASNATFAVPETKWGLIAGSGTNVRLPQQISWPIAMELLLTGDTIGAERAAEIGLINRVVAPGTAVEEAIGIAKRIADNGPLAVRTAKEIAVRSRHLEQDFAFEHAMNVRILSSNDAREGVASFTERRKADFTGR